MGREEDETESELSFVGESGAGTAGLGTESRDKPGDVTGSSKVEELSEEELRKAPCADLESVRGKVG